ncbi:TolC family protein [Aerosticca soli]|uniref:TolC family protein n=1 Tax=Aerosticca soli TaxID=2010829 RepID=UPI001386E666|nr:TolC family protein [Aerosticca soli]
MRRLGCIFALICLPVFAQTGADTSLPPRELVLDAIESAPEVRAAEAGVARAEAEERMRRAGPHEAQFTVIPQRRRVDQEGRYHEWEVDLSRGVRWPGKARLDREIGATGREAAQLMLEDAHHAAARRLLALWTDWQRAAAATALRQQQAQLWQQELASVDRRVALGDAAQRDRLAVDAALAQAQVAVLQAQAEETRARLALQAQFPGLPLPAQVRLPPQPDPLPGQDAHWQALIVARSHEIGAADARARQKDAEARRAQADRTPDPVLGLRMLDERGGREHTLGVTMTIPFGIAYRGAAAAAAGADAMAAAADLAITRRDIEEGAHQVVAAARAAFAVWQRQREARDAAETSAAKTERAYALGELGLVDVLAARRLAEDSALAEQRALLDAIEAVTRVQVDAHEVWHAHAPGDTDEDAPVRPGQPALPTVGGG